MRGAWRSGMAGLVVAARLAAGGVVAAGFGVAVLLACMPAVAQDVAGGRQQVAPGVPAGTGLPIPRFVVLRAEEVNLRAGPGPRYPVEWVFRRRDLPVEITAEFDTWRRIRDIEGTEGWVHQSLLSGGKRRTVIVVGEIRTLRASASPTAAPVARAEPGVVARLRRCKAEWCEVEAGGRRGWLTRQEVWGVYPDEVLD